MLSVSISLHMRFRPLSVPLFVSAKGVPEGQTESGDIVLVVIGGAFFFVR